MSQTARDIMTSDVKVLKADDSVKHAARFFVENKIGGAPVVDDNGNLIGLISESDLISQDVKIHFPSYIHFLDSYIFLGSQKRFEETLKRAAAAKVGELMATEVVSVKPDTDIEEVATLMMEKHIGRVPVVEDGRVLGLITKGDIVRTLSR